MPSRLAALAVVALVLAGCVGLPGSGRAPASPTGQPTDSTTGAEPQATDYETLPVVVERLFLEALENGSAATDATAIAAYTRDIEYVRYEGTRYSLTWRRGLRAEYRLDSVEVVNDSEVDTGARTVAYANLSSTGRRFFDLAVNGSGSRRVGSEAFPEGFFEYDFVEYRGRYYEPRITVADIPQWRLHVEEAPADDAE